MENPTPKNKGTNSTLIIIGVVVAVICACVLITSALGVVMYRSFSDVVSTVGVSLTEVFDFPSPTPEPIVTRPAVGDISTDTLTTLMNTIVPEN
ncbi:MAG: hypothetical protein Q7J80_13625, partial [Anaerolineales bacterium]|nr:hypothetical protein [Anaerolineales bacterium]